MKKIICLMIVLSVLFSFCAGAESYSLNGADLSFESANDLMTHYVTKDGSAARILNSNKLYKVDTATSKASVEHEFPASQYNFDINGGYYGSQSYPQAYLDNENGLLYYACNSYRNTYSEDETINVAVYDLEGGKELRSVQIKGHIMNSVGADRSGRIFIATDDYSKTDGESSSLIVLNTDGSVAFTAATEYPINEFCGFLQNGTFFYIDEYMAYSAYGYANLMGRLREAKFDGKSASFEDSYLFYAKNIYFANRRDPIEILSDKYLVTASGQVIPTDSIKDKSYSLALYAENDLEKGDDDFIYTAGSNMLYNADSIYALSNNSTIIKYDLNTEEKKEFYTSSKYIFNMRLRDDCIYALETDKNSFYYEIIPLSDFKKITLQKYNMNDFSVYSGRTKADIVKRFSKAVPAVPSAELSDTAGSATAPYAESIMNDQAKSTALNLTNYYRWLGGLTKLGSADDETWANAAKGAVLLQASGFSHSPDQPADMDDDFYNAAKSATQNSNIAMNYISGQNKLLYSIRQFMNDSGYTMPGHRTNFLMRNATTVAYGAFSRYMCQTVGYDGNPNELGTAKADNNKAAYAWPSPGYFPAEEISSDAYWTVNLNTDKLDLSNLALKVKITDLKTNEVFERTSSSTGLYATTYWGRFISFAPPDSAKDGYAGKKYRVEITNLSDENILPASLSYTVDFFSYEGRYVIDGKIYDCDANGKLTLIADAKILKGDANLDGSVNLADVRLMISSIASDTPLGDVAAENADLTGDKSVTLADVRMLISLLSQGTI